MCCGKGLRRDTLEVVVSVQLGAHGKAMTVWRAFFVAQVV